MPIKVGTKLKPWTEERHRKMEAFFARIRGVKKGPRCPLEDRFWPKVNKHGPTIYPELGPCWMWTGAHDGFGYGMIGIDGKNHKAHRVSWEFKHGKKPTDDILHKCDNPPCVNWDHVYEGTPSDNLRECVAKGRHNTLREGKHPRAKLTKDKVREIRRRVFNGETQATMVREFGVAHTTIWNIVTRKNWPNV